MPSHGIEQEEDKPCRACTDFKSWAKKQSKAPQTNQTRKEPVECPLDKNELGRSTWGFLHSMASHFPDKPTRIQSDDMARFFNIFAQFYPCEPCAKDFYDDIKVNPPKTKSRAELEKWLCERHNTVNVKLNKPVYDCGKMRERWRDGWLDGSCD